MNASDLRHAYAVLGLSPPLTEAALKRRYKSLARRWHPDRYQADPVGQAEATETLRDINIAYERSLYRFIGWLLMVLPAVLITSLLIAA
jgi:curved DNA-binding protein CbpA